MNQMSTRNRKFIYMGGILLLLFPIAVLGMPATQPTKSGGMIARQRQEYKLGEATLGDVDPTSATMNLVLLGMRGIAGSVLWTQAEQQKMTKNWSELESTVESIIKLQPRFMGVWKYQSWNLAYNVSAECDAVEDRFFWVKKGAKFLLRGINQNDDSAELPHQMGEFLGKKMGRADERRQFRQFFKSDPDPRFDGLPDPELNRNQQDNYLVAKEYYETANRKEELPGVEQHIMARPLFRSYPWRSQMDYAAAIESEGTFGEVAREAWLLANAEWRTRFGRERFISTTGNGGEFELEATREEIYKMADSDGTDPEEKLQWQEHYRKMTNYTYWRNRSDVESQREMTDARSALYEGKQKFFAADLQGARNLFEDGLTKLERLFAQYPGLLTEDILDDELIEEALKSLLMWKYVLQLNGEEIPEQYPLKHVWDANPERVVQLEEMFQEKVNAI
jgi:hypothetical protein